MKNCYLLAFVLLAVTGTYAQELRPIRLKSGELAASRNLRNVTNLAGALQPVQYDNRYYTLIRFSQAPDSAARQALVREGITLFDYIADSTWLAEVTGQPNLLLNRKMPISGLYTLDAAAKISGKLKQQWQQSAPDPHQLIGVHYFGHIDRATVITELTRAGAQIAETKIQPQRVVFIRANATVVNKIAALPFVSFIGSQHMKDVPINYNDHGVHAVNALNAATGRNLQGRQVTLGIGDNGEISSHTDFSGRLINRNPMGAEHHAIHTAGTMAGAGIIDPRQQGMAPKATIIGQYFSDILVNTPYYVNDFGMVLTSNSYYSGQPGCPGNGDYDFLSYYVDAQMIADPALLHVFASGNDGRSNCSPWLPNYHTVKSGFQCGKNVLTVGAINHFTFNVAEFSSRGPVDDGRLKPEVVASGEGVWSTTTNNGYTNDWGTSMATPAVTGMLGLLYERYRQLHGGANPASALVKAIACNSADDLGNPGPDYIYGFGKINARKAVEAIENNTYFTGTVAQGAVSTHTISGVPAGTAQLKVLLYWNDPAAAPNAVNALVNNLNLTVTTPGSTIHYPLVLNPAAGQVNAPAIEGVDNRNNIEQVVINAPASGDYAVTITGANIPAGPQPYVVAYELVSPSVTVEYPFGGETLVPGQAEVIRWNAPASNTNTFTVEYTTNDGATRQTINSSVAAHLRVLSWTVPAVPTGTARVRVSINTTGYSDVSDGPCTILGQPALTVTHTCPGYAVLSWSAIPSATGYEIMMLKGDSMQPIATTTNTSYLLGGLNTSEKYWLGVRALMGSVTGRRSVSQEVIPASGSCDSVVFENDLKADELVAPVTGRMFTASQLGVVYPQLRIRNLGSVATSGSITASYQVNNGTVITENIGQSIDAASSHIHTFTTPYDFSATGAYTIKAWVAYGSDGQAANDTLVTIIKHLQNDPIDLSTPFTEDFESATAQSYSSGAMGFEGLDRCDFRSNNTNGRARTFVHTGMARSGNRAATLDQQVHADQPSADSLIMTFNLGNYSATDQIWLSFYYLNHGINFDLPGNKVWIRGSETGNWIPITTLSNDNNTLGEYLKAPAVNITEILANAVPAQTVSSSFQVKFGEEGYTSVNSMVLDRDLDDGYTYDDINFTLASNDAAVLELVAPATHNMCALSNAENIIVRVKNYSASPMFMVPVSYQINGGTPVTEQIPSIPAGETLDYVFLEKADLSAYQSYSLTTWISNAGDDYSTNDSASFNFRTAPYITSFPYLQDFENSDGDWYTGGFNSSWVWDTPQGTVINKAASGEKAWLTGLNGHNNNEDAYLYSPCFNLSAMSDPVLSFSHIFKTEDDCVCDYHRVEYSTNGVDWFILGEAGQGANWYDNPLLNVWQASNTKWHVSSIDNLNKAAKIRFRFLMHSDPALTMEGVGIDDIHIFDRASTTIYDGPDITSGLSKPVSGNNWIHFDAGGGRVVSIHPHDQDLGNTEVKVFIYPGPVRNDGSQYYLNRNMVIQPTNAPTAPVSVRFYYLHSEADSLIFADGCSPCTSIADAYEVGITQYSNAPAEENGTLSDNANGVYSFISPSQVTAVPYDKGYYAEYQVSTFSEFWINGGGPDQNKALPLVLKQFSATLANNTGLLQWQTLQETNTDEFLVERSADGIHYESIGKVAAAGNSDTILHYSFTDKQLLNGLNYYRLKMISKDGSFEYSPVRRINNINGNITVSLRPNPVTKGVVQIITSLNCTRIELHDVAGRLLKTVNMQGMQNQLPVHDLAKGVYFITVHTDGGKKMEKLVVR
jgi:Subtilisin-like serine proteases